MIVMHAELPVDPDSHEEAVSLVTELAERSRQEPGVIEYRAATDIEDGTTIRVLERYEDEDALEDHMASDHFGAFQSSVTGVLAGAPSLRRFDVERDVEVM